MLWGISLKCWFAPDDIRLSMDGSGPEENKTPDRKQEEAEKVEDDGFHL
jgi:hypothetical protein